MASTATGSFGKKPVSILNGAFTVPHPTNKTSNITATSLFSIKNLMLLFSIKNDFKQLNIDVLKNIEYDKSS